MAERTTTTVLEIPTPCSPVGKPAPDFSVEGYFKGKFDTYALKNLGGKWLYLLFYPLDFTFVCPTEVLSFSKQAAEFEKRNCQLLGVSVDSKFVHKAWVESKYEDGGLGGSLNYPLLADLNKQMAKDFGVLMDGGVALRGSFLIDPKGVVMHAVVNNLSVGRSAAEALRTLKAFQYVTSHEGEVCPADWDEGEDTMKADPQSMAKFLAAHNK
jgi:peroxiredoxin (alkyl hydroperoxide reductase subunit C)